MIHWSPIRVDLVVDFLFGWKEVNDERIKAKAKREEEGRNDIGGDFYIDAFIGRKSKYSLARLYIDVTGGTLQEVGG
jgi:hypothetical protein